MMLYGAITMGLCHLIASLCLKAGDEDESKKRLVSLTHLCQSSKKANRLGRWGV